MADNPYDAWIEQRRDFEERQFVYGWDEYEREDEWEEDEDE